MDLKHEKTWQMGENEIHFLLCCQKASLTPGSYYDCDLLPFFELGSVHYHFYLINIRIPVVSKMQVNQDIGKIDDIQFIVRTTFLCIPYITIILEVLYLWLAWKIRVNEYDVMISVIPSGPSIQMQHKR